MEVKIAVAYHKPSVMLTHRSYIPIQVGSILHPEVNLDIQKDSEGDNISNENGYFCELTALYWLWKNTTADAKGLFHYRRVFTAEKSARLDFKTWLKGIMRRSYTPSLTYGSDDFVKAAHKFAELVPEYLKEFDILASKPCICQPDVYTYFSIIGQDYLKILIEALTRTNPVFHKSLMLTLRSKKLYYGNMTVMKNEEFETYCEFLFGTLNRVKAILLEENYLKNLSGEKIFDRKLGYLAEILTSVYISHRQNESDLRIKEFHVAMAAQ